MSPKTLKDLTLLTPPLSQYDLIFCQHSSQYILDIHFCSLLSEFKLIYLVPYLTSPLVYVTTSQMAEHARHPFSAFLLLACDAQGTAFLLVFPSDASVLTSNKTTMILIPKWLHPCSPPIGWY